RIHRSDAQRIGRALEVFHATGTPLSDLQGRGRAPFLTEALSIALIPERARLHTLIAERFAAMLAAGLVEEVQSLRQRYVLNATLPSMRCVGYRQVWQVLEGEATAETLLARGTAATRQLAKRQFTWLRALPATSFDPWSGETVAAVSALILDALAART
ncbi:MAG: tRNA (adenosine(37)-N6)-dimethylallyltransferase MiaA, partial [Pseudomonadota bacterium]|nr:tRNA (adenosine(37)-N6)-dimethylallyltransferase MiaA [Pseudomonadota bacterium]